MCELHYNLSKCGGQWADLECTTTGTLERSSAGLAAETAQPCQRSDCLEPRGGREVREGGWEGGREGKGETYLDVNDSEILFEAMANEH